MSKHYHEIITLTIDRREESHKILPGDVIRAVAEVYNICPEGMLSKSRLRYYAWPRQMAYLVMKERCSYLSWPQIARKCRREDHSTCMQGARVMRDRCQVHAESAEAYRRVTEKLNILYHQRMKAYV